MADHVIVETTSGKIRGIADKGVNIFKGIPYAGPADGAHRFSPPAKPERWPGMRDTFEYGPTAMQDPDAFGLSAELVSLLPLREPIPMDENCLVLNVWTPAVNDGPKRPVMFWCHGGAFISGSGSSAWYDGSKLCGKGDVVVVTINHRLGAFGYLHLEDLNSRFKSSGNVGMLDIVAALQWVRDNIANFGGDPGNVTIFGESGGGAKVSVLMAMPAAHGLFHKAIIQSGPAVEMMRRDDATAMTRQVLGELGVGADQTDKLRDIPANRLLDAQIAVLKKISLMSFANRRRVGFNPVIDGSTLPAGPFAPTAPAISSHVPLMIGTNKDEMTLFFALAPWIEGMDDASLRERVRMFVGERGDSLIAQYKRARPYDSARDLMMAIATDAGMRIPSLTIADRKAAQNAASVFVYLFTWETPVLNGRLKSPHALEIPFVFDTLESAPLPGNSPTRSALADKMSQTWIAFASTGDPNNPAIPQWPAYSTSQRPTMIFDNECHVVNDPYGAERQAWDR
ncbi:MAG TPA: carboxylesterase/lipase family protein [Candidatus Binataceae bacterium]|nr:carboxylesterase/lipase family protein [Candidatus Binataceae bacterium]